jgi:HTH-type transcriptional repressor of NAD biosynthesis genes
LEQKKQYKKGFVLGKFLPPHKGHQFLIQSALKYVEELTILVCTIQKEPIAGELRYAWMKELYPHLNVKHITDEVPSYPHEHLDFWNIWTTLLKRNVDNDTEVFFSSEEYGFEVAHKLNIKHIMIDKERQMIPVSATAIRTNPFANWNFIPENVKPYFCKKIVLTGPESTGKTSLAQLLAQHYQTSWVEEYGRDYFVNKNGNLELSDITEIAKGQIKLEQEAAKKANKLLFCDTDLIVTQIWSEIYFQKCPPELLALNLNRNYDLYLLMDIDIPWEDDGTREFPNLRQWHFDRIKNELDNRQLNYVVISGDYESRLLKAKNSIDDFINKGK